MSNRATLSHGIAQRIRVVWLLFIALACARSEPAGMPAAAAPEAPTAIADAEELLYSMTPASAPAPAPPPAPSAIGAPVPAQGQLASAPAPSSQAAPDAAPGNERGPLLIYSATLTLAVFGTEQALAAVEQLAKERRGYLVRRSDNSITIRVPAAAFDQTLAGVSQLGDELHREVTARDVTEEYSDLQIRLRNAEVMRQRLEALLEKATKVEDALAVERELERVTETIEQLKGRLRLLEELLAYSTITVNFQPRHVETVSTDVPLPFEWLPQLGLSNLLSL